MSNYLSEQEKRVFRSKVFHAAAKLFLEKGYSRATTRAIAKCAGVNVSAMNRQFGTKENILCELVRFVLNGQLRTAREIIAEKTDDPILFYAVETALQLYMAESSASVRELYLAAYSQPRSSALICTMVSQTLLPRVFVDYLPGRSKDDFYQLEIASGGVIRGYIAVPCSPEFTMEQKTAHFLDASLRIYHVPADKIQEAIGFVKQFDLQTIARDTIISMLRSLKDPAAGVFALDGTEWQITQENHTPKEETI